MRTAAAGGAGDVRDARLVGVEETGMQPAVRSGRRPATVARRAVFAAAVVAQLVALYWPRPVETGTSLPVDKLAHLAIFGAVLWAGVRAGLPPRPLAAALVVHAGLSEVLQATLLDRHGDVVDAVADVAGVGLGWLVAARGARSTGTGPPADEGAPHRR